MSGQQTERALPRAAEERAIGGMDEPATAEFLDQENRQVLDSYRARPSLIEENANYEKSTAEGAYGRRQLYELIQNGSDAILASGKPGVIRTILTESALYCANTGEGVTRGGLRAILQAYMSPKEGEEIGRYGLGFKSVLGATKSPEFYSHTVSFRFDEEWSREQIRKATGYEGATPALRLARTMDRDAATSRDSILAELLGSASTVVKLPFARQPSWLRANFEEFPNGFLLFCSHVETLVLDDRSHGLRREIRRSDEDPVRIEENGQASEWRVFRREIHPTDAARLEGGAGASRDCVVLSWALPLSGGLRERGCFWAYFPLRNEPMSMAGILNAAWKLNDDRQNILEGSFNEELLEHATMLVLDSLPALMDDKDPAKILDVYPARLAERVTYADHELTAAFYRHASDYPTVPDVEGQLRKASDLELPPSKGELNDEGIEAWARCPYKPANWAHTGTIMQKDRSARLDYLMPQGASRAGIRKWLEALCSGALAALPDDVSTIDHEIRVRRSKWALIAAKALREKSREVLDAKIVLTESGDLVSPNPSLVFLPGMDGKRYARVELADAGLARDPEALHALTELGIHEVDASSELKALLAEHPIRTLSHAEWRELWELVGRVERDPRGEGQSAKIISETIEGESPLNVVHVQTIDGEMHPLVETLLTGPIVPFDGSRDSDVAIDRNFHAAHMATLRQLGAIDQPDTMTWRQDEAWVRGYHGEMTERFRASLKPGQNKPQPQMLKLVPKTYVGPLAAFPRLSAEGKRLFTRHILAHEQALLDWSMTHETRAHYGTIECESPCSWMLKKYGMVSTSQGIRLLGTSVGSRLSKWINFLPVAEGIDPETEVVLGLPQAPQEITPAEWKKALTLLYGCEFNPLEIAGFYAEFCRTHEAPDGLRCIDGDKLGVFPPEEVTLAPFDDRLVCDALREERIPFLVVDNEEADRELRLRWGLKSFRDVIRIESHYAPSGPDTPLVDQYPGLLALAPTDISEILLVPCKSLRREIRTDRGVKAEEVSAWRDHNRILYDDGLSREDLLQTISEQLELPITPEQKLAILSQQLDAELQARIRKIAGLGDPAKKLLQCVGAEPLRKRLTRPLLDSVQRRFGELNDIDYARLFLSVCGVEALSSLKEELKSAGFRAPEQWAGGHAARAFVADLGFASVYAGFNARGSREPYLDIEPTPELPPLHEFQKKVVQNIKRLLTDKNGTQRGLLSLPTGAGKTRVAVEALTQGLVTGKMSSPVLWIAQTDELCEQAVQAWSEVWRATASSRELRVNRLWAQNAADRYEDAFQVVVATIQKLEVIAGYEEYDWLKNAGAVIVDEAHYSVTPEYSRILEWLGVSDKHTRSPLIGLTATAFRGGERETKQLVRRYADNRLDKGAFKNDPYAELQKMGVLSQVDHERLDGVEVTLTETETNELKKLNQLPAAAVRRIAEDLDRNAKIIESVRSKPDSWSILIFAASVEHARTLTALLEREGISSASVSAETSPGARRHYIEQFRAQQLRVLTNYGVLTTGFDAPAVRAIYVTRPTFSHSLYQQMIGRGLRGVKNGGKERCLIVNVDDNFERYGIELAFRGFEPLWSRT